MNGNLLGRLNTQPDFVTSDFHHHNGDVIVDDNTFVLFPRQHQHGAPAFPTEGKQLSTPASCQGSQRAISNLIISP